MPASPAATQEPATPTPSASVLIGDVLFPAELAVSPEERGQGLSGRESLPPGTGMLFVFENLNATNFWMAGVLFPLDFIWISRECAVVDITRDAPPVPTVTPGSQIPIYRSSAPASFNFEINGGEAETHGLAIGDEVRFFGVSTTAAAICETTP